MRLNHNASCNLWRIPEYPVKNTTYPKFTVNFLTCPGQDPLSGRDICKWRLFLYCQNMIGVTPIFEPQPLSSVPTTKEVNLHSHSRDLLSKSDICDSGCFRSVGIC